MVDLLPGGYYPPVLELLPHPLRHLYSVTVVPAAADPFDLTVEHGSLSVTFSEDWAPFAQVEFQSPVTDADVLDLMDPRTNCRVLVHAGYEYPGGREDVLPLADVGLRERPVSRPANLMTVRAASDEARAQDYRLMWSGNLNRSGVNEAAEWLLRFALAPETPVIRSDFPAGSKAAALADMEADIGDDAWSLLDDVAARAGVRIWCDENRVWRIEARAERTSWTSLDLTVGAAGTVVTSDSSLTREEWYNAAVLRYRWQDAARNEYVRIGRARVEDGGPYSVTEVGAKVYFEERERPASQAGADAAAVSRLRTLVTRGRSLSLTAGAAYWLRPGHTVRVKLKTGNWTNHLVQSVKFRPHEGLMDLVTRLPENVNIRSGE